MHCQNRLRKISLLLFTFLLVISSLLSNSSESYIQNTTYLFQNDRVEEQYLWTTAQVLSNESNLRSLRPGVAIDHLDNVHFVWQDMTDLSSAGSDDDIFYKMWNVTSEEWSSISVLSPSGTTSSQFPNMVIDEFNNIHVAWLDRTDILGAGIDSDILYRNWNFTTNSWNAIELVSTQSTSDVYWVDLDVKDGVIYLVWQDSTNYLGNGGDEDILFSQRFLNGTWTQAETISTEGSLTSGLPDIQVDENSNIHVCWEDFANYLSAGSDEDIFYRFYNTTTDIWSSIKIISSSSASSSEHSKLAVYNNESIFITWVDESNILSAGNDHDIFYRSKDYTTDIWSEVKLVTQESTSDSDVPSVVTDEHNNIHFFWFDTTDLDSAGVDQDIFYKMWNSTTDIWSNFTVVSVDSTADSWRPEVDIDSHNRLHLVWQDRTANYGGSGSDIDILYSIGTEWAPSPFLTFRNHPLEEVHITQDTELSLSWTVSDINVSLPAYSIYLNDVLNTSGSWITDTPIVFSMGNLEIGNYTFRFVAMDGWGEIVHNTVTVFVSSNINQWVKPFVNAAIGFGIAMVPILSTTTVVLFIKKRRSTQ